MVRWPLVVPNHVKKYPSLRPKHLYAKISLPKTWAHFLTLIHGSYLFSSHYRQQLNAVANHGWPRQQRRPRKRPEQVGKKGRRASHIRSAAMETGQPQAATSAAAKRTDQSGTSMSTKHAASAGVREGDGSGAGKFQCCPCPLDIFTPHTSGLQA